MKPRDEKIVDSLVRTKEENYNFIVFLNISHAICEFRSTCDVVIRKFYPLSVATLVNSPVESVEMAFELNNLRLIYSILFRYHIMNKDETCLLQGSLTKKITE